MQPVKHHKEPGSAFDGDMAPLHWFTNETEQRLTSDQQFRLAAFRAVSKHCRKKANQPHEPTMMWIEKAERAERAASKILQSIL